MLPSSKNCDGTAVEKGEILAQQLVVIDNNDVTHHEPVSPGTAGLLLEEQEKKTRWSKQLKFNKAFDIAKALTGLKILLGNAPDWIT